MAPRPRAALNACQLPIMAVLILPIVENLLVNCFHISGYRYGFAYGFANGVLNCPFIPLFAALAPAEAPPTFALFVPYVNQSAS